MMTTTELAFFAGMIVGVLIPQLFDAWLNWCKRHERRPEKRDDYVAIIPKPDVRDMDGNRIPWPPPGPSDRPQR